MYIYQLLPSNKMEIDIKELEGATLMPLDDGRLAYVDKSGTVHVYGLKEEMVPEPEEFETGFIEGAVCEPSDIEFTADPGFMFTSVFSDQCSGLVLASEDEPIPHVDQINNQFLDHGRVADEEDDTVDVKRGTSLRVLQDEDDCVEQVTLFKCRACLFTAPEKNLILDHFTQEHINVIFSTNTAPVSSGNIPVSEEFERLAQSVTADSQEVQIDCPDTQESAAERLLYLCVQCQGAFDSIELCKQHMIQEHKFVSGKGKSKSKPGETLSTGDLISSQTSSTSAKSPFMTVMDVGGVQVEWQSLDLPVPPQSVENEGISLPEKDVNVESDSSSIISDKNVANTPKLEVQKVKERTRKIKCSFRSCISKFSNEKALQTHMSCHSKNPTVKEFQCIHCSEKFVRWRLCSAHLWRVHKVDVDLLACPVCLTYKAATPLKLEIHLRTHGDLRPYRCKLCPKSFKQSSQLRNHCTSVHFDKKVGDANPRWYMEQQCNQCGKTYSDAKSLKRHIQSVHSKMKPYVCTVCGHTSAFRAMLQLHMRQHTGDKPHACTQCDYRSGDHNTLRRHMMRHTGQRPYKCPHCPYSAIQSSCYKAHLRNRHPGESGLFSCSSCSFQTISQDAYVQHIADHQKGLIAPKEVIQNMSDNGDGVEYFPGNVAAAHLVYRYLGTFLQEPGGKLPPANITDSQTSADGTTQSITIQIPTQETSSVEIEDDESSHSFLLKGTDEDVGIDTGGITIPAEPDVALV